MERNGHDVEMYSNKSKFSILKVNIGLYGEDIKDLYWYNNFEIPLCYLKGFKILYGNMAECLNIGNNWINSIIAIESCTWGMMGSYWIFYAEKLKKSKMVTFYRFSFLWLLKEYKKSTSTLIIEFIYLDTYTFECYSWCINVIAMVYIDKLMLKW